MSQSGRAKGALPNLSLAETHRKAEAYSLSGLHRQSNTAAKHAILHELHSSMQLRAEKIRLQSRGSPSAPRDTQVLHASEQKELTARENLSAGTAKQVTFHLSNRDPTDGSARGQSRIPVPVQHGSRGQPVTSGQATHLQQGSRGKAGPGRPKTRGGGGKRQEKGQATFQYTWGLRGRLNELRIRFLARKFFFFWRRNTFAGVKPSVIRRHYQSRLLRKAFEEWREYWWIQRREWTLMIRAEYHHRYRIFQHVWLTWRAFVVRERVKNAKREIASTYASRVLLRKALDAWKGYIVQRRSKAVMGQRARRYNERRLLAAHWVTWRVAMQRGRERAGAETYALQYWAENVTQNAWGRWRRRYQERQEMKQKEAYAKHLYEKTLVARCFFQGLVPYTLHRRDRRQSNAQAAQVYMERLLVSAWQHWHQRWFTRRSLALRQEQVDRLGDRARMRRTLTHWRFYIHLLNTERAKEEMAREHHCTHLKKYVLLGLRLAFVQRRVKVRRTEQAVELHQEMLVKRYWNCWLVQCENSEELKLFAATRKARLLHRKRMLGKAVQQWWDYTKWRRHRKEQYLRADVYYARHTLPQCLNKLRLNAELEKRKRELAAQSSQFYREGLLGQFFYRWWHSYHTSKDVRMMERMAFLHHESILAKRFFTEWRERTRAKLKETQKMYLAIDHHQASLCRRALQRWMEFIREGRQRSEYERQAAEHDYLQAVRKAWTVWREYVVERRRKASKKARADSFYHRKQMKRLFTAWKLHCRGMKKVYQVVSVKQALANHRKLRYALAKWREYTGTEVEEHSKEQIAVSHWQSRLMSKVTRAWYAYAQQHAANAAIKLWRLEQLQLQLDQGKLKRAFQAWREHSQMAAADKLQEEKADAFHDQRLKRRCLQHWIQFRLLCLKKTLIARQATWFNQIRMQSKYFGKWKLEYAEAREEHGKTVMALWLWSMHLQQRALHTWVAYAREKQRKKARIAVALEARRTELLREGVRQWLTVAACLGERRATIAAKHHAQTSYKSYQVVQRCASHWRQKTLANRGKKKTRPPVHARRKVTFEDERSSRGHGSKVKAPITGQASVAVPVPPLSSHLPVISLSTEGRLLPAETRGQSIRVGDRPGNSLPVTGKVRPKPRRPDFLRDSLQREGLWSHSPVKVQSDSSQDQQNTACHKEEQIPSLPPTSHDGNPSERSWIIPSHDTLPIANNDANMRPLPLRTESGTIPSDNEGQVSNGQDVPLHAEGVARSSATEGQSVKTKTHMRKMDDISGSEDEENKSGKFIKNMGKMDIGNFESSASKPPVLLPPSAFASAASSQAVPAGKPPPLSDRGNMMSHAPPPSSRGTLHHPSAPKVAPLSTRGPIETSIPKQDVYGEIQRLKNTLQGYQDLKARLKKLQSQEAELLGWLKELNLSSSTEDSAGLLIGDELTLVQEEIEALKVNVRQSKPQIKGLLAQITQLTQQATG